MDTASFSLATVRFFDLDAASCEEVAGWQSRLLASAWGSHSVFTQQTFGDEVPVSTKVLNVVPLPAFTGLELPETTVPPANGPDEFKGLHERSNGQFGPSWSSHDYLIHQVGQAADTRAVHQP